MSGSGTASSRFEAAASGAGAAGAELGDAAETARGAAVSSPGIVTEPAAGAEVSPPDAPKSPIRHAAETGVSSFGAIVQFLACPECAAPITERDRCLRCPHGHSFDIAKQGYVSLLTGASTKMTGDSADMLNARAAFQGSGHFSPIAEAIAHAVAGGAAETAAGGAAESSGGPAVLELGSGTGYYLAAVLDALAESHGIALDVSKYAARRAARAHPRAASVLADAWRGLPVRDAALSHVLSVFAPRNPAEVARVLAPGGTFVVVTPTARHLGELIGPLGMITVDGGKDTRLADTLSTRFVPLDRTPVEYPMSLGHTDIANVAAMGPSAHHAAADRAERLAALPERLDVTASVTVARYGLR
ncbi:putative RNA methyltransferase [Nocardia aurantia]|uniref:putative RNA methyltransferase n=1 Tax=Nocardia aurantia TaxID=2585199 RepID=UPI003872DE8D